MYYNSSGVTIIDLSTGSTIAFEKGDRTSVPSQCNFLRLADFHFSFFF